MKRFFVLLCLGIGGFLVLGACQKDNADIIIWEPGSQEYGFAKGKKNGKKFEASAFAKRYKSPNEDYIFIHFTTFSSKGYKREKVVIGDGIDLKKKDYNLKITDVELDVTDNIADISYNTSVDGGDIQGDRYLLDLNVGGNKLSITEVDTAKGIVKGELTATLNHSAPNDKTDPRNPNKIKFKKVQFEATIIN